MKVLCADRSRVRPRERFEATICRRCKRISIPETLFDGGGEVAMELQSEEEVSGVCVKTLGNIELEEARGEEAEDVVKIVG